MKQPVDYKQKYTEVRKELTQLKKIVQKQDQYIVNLLDRIAELNKNSMRVEGAAIEKEKEKTRLLAKELRNTKKELKEKTKTIERLTRLSFENGFGLVGAREAIKKLNEQRNTDLRPLKRKLEPVIDPTPKVAPSQHTPPCSTASGLQKTLHAAMGAAIISPLSAVATLVFEVVKGIAQ